MKIDLSMIIDNKQDRDPNDLFCEAETSRDMDITGRTYGLSIPIMVFVESWSVFT